MSGFNSSVLLFVWSVALIFLIDLSWPYVGAVSMAVVLVALILARSALLSLVRRSRWLLLMALVMFGWMTPGMPVSWLPGATLDGLQQAAEQISRLLASIAMVSMLLSRLDELSLLTACHGLLRPLRLLRVDVGRLVLRLALTLRQLDGGDGLGGGGLGMIHLPRQSMRIRDFVLLGAVVTMVGMHFL